MLSEYKPLLPERSRNWRKPRPTRQCHFDAATWLFHFTTYIQMDIDSKCCSGISFRANEYLSTGMAIMPDGGHRSLSSSHWGAQFTHWFSYPQVSPPTLKCGCLRFQKK